MTMTALTVTRDLDWTQTNWLPTARHRNPQTRKLTATVTLSIPVIDPADAPIAYVIPTEVWDEDAHKNVPGAPTVYRVRDGVLYRQATAYNSRKQEPIEATESWLLSYNVGDVWDLRYDTEDEAVRAAAQRVESFIIVDGWAWTPSREPVYVVERPTGFYARRGDSVRIDVTSAPDLSEIADASFFPADKLDAAVAFATKLAEEEDATTGRLAETTIIEYTGAHQPGSTWRQAPRISYPSVHGIQWGAPLSVWFDALDEFRASVAANYPDFLIEQNDGFGGTYRTIDPIRLTVQQRDDYKMLLQKTNDATVAWGK